METLNRRSLPSVDRVLRTAPVVALTTRYNREAVVRLVRETVQEVREGRLPAPADPESLGEEVAVRARRWWSVGPSPVINATGVILHTNLGRAPLSQQALAAVQQAAAYTDLEYDLASGERGSRQDNVTALLRALTGAPASHVTVNNAAATLLALAALARGREVVVSRGQAVEIGGGFRVPVIMRQSGARLVEVGTTNRTRLSDYADAIGPRTGAILHVHTSNFKLVGFTEDVPLPSLATLAREAGVPLLDDNGSGALLDTAPFGLAHEPTPLDSLAAGADVVAFSGDKLLGGPQAGIVVGRPDLIARLAAHPLARALRPDKVALAALSATLMAYLQDEALDTLPVWRMIKYSEEELRARADGWRREAAGAGISVATESGTSTVGGGSLPGETLPTTLLVLPRGVTAAQLRQASPRVVCRTRGGHALLDLRTVAPEQEEPLLNAVRWAAGRVDGQKNRVLDSSAK